jgi:hypothetical protein
MPEGNLKLLPDLLLLVSLQCGVYFGLNQDTAPPPPNPRTENSNKKAHPVRGRGRQVFCPLIPGGNVVT